MPRKIPRYDSYPQVGSNPFDPNLALANCNPVLIAMGVVNGISHINKFGENTVVAVGTTEDVWGGGGTYSFPTTADITHLRQAVDQAAMRGQIVQVQGLDVNWALVTQDVVLNPTNTTTPVALATPLLRAFRMEVHANVVATQEIQLRNVGGGTTYAIISTPDNQTLMAIYTVPAGKTAYMTGYYASNAATTARTPDQVDFQVWTADRGNGYAFQLKHMRAIGAGNDGFQHFFNPPMKVTEKSDIKISATVIGSVGEDGDCHAGFDLILIDN